MAVFNHRFRNTAHLVLAALNELSEQGGSSAETISDYIASEFSVPDKDFKQYVGKVIEKGVEFGAIRKVRGKYRLGETLNAEVSKLNNSIVTACNKGRGRRGKRGIGKRKQIKSSRGRSGGKRKRYGKKR